MAVSFCLSSSEEHDCEKCYANGGLIIVIILVFQLVYTEAVMENSPSSMFVLKVSASDPDVGANGQISYTLHGPDADKFHLDHRTGMMVCVWGQNMSAASKCECLSDTISCSDSVLKRAKNISTVFSFSSQELLTDIHHTLFLS